MPVKYPLFIILFVLLIGGCGSQGVLFPSLQTDTKMPEKAALTHTPLAIKKTEATATPAITASATPPPAKTERLKLTIWISPGLPEALLTGLRLPPEINRVSNMEEANLYFSPVKTRQIQNQEILSSDWVYALVAPFPTIMDGVNLADIKNVWAGKKGSINNDNPILMTADTYQTFQEIWGPSENGVKIEDKNKLIDTAWKMPAWAIVPFDELDPRWKVLQVNSISPLDKNYNSETYPLAINFSLTVNPMNTDFIISQARSLKFGPAVTNRDRNKLTVLVMTGTTALSRNTAAKIEENGLAYPARDIGAWLNEADLTHISNEVPMFADCPPAVPVRHEMRFCSSPRYFELLKEVGVDLIELTGNHELDYGVDAFRETLDIYRQNDIPYYGGGENLEEAKKPLFIEHNGNRLVFIGCNAVGPEGDLATKDLPGAAPCDLDSLETQVRELRSQGYLPVVSFQHFEFGTFDGYKPQSAQRVDFQRIAAAGAVIVSGSQAHYPQAMTFIGNNFVHYGLGNLFFDQMDKETRREFIDRHIFYNGRYISTELLTAMLEDYARPRPMILQERVQLLQDIFGASEWQKAGEK